MSLCCCLQSEHGCRLPAELPAIKVSLHLPHQSREGQLSDQQLCVALIEADLFESFLARPVPLGALLGWQHSLRRFGLPRNSAGPTHHLRVLRSGHGDSNWAVTIIFLAIILQIDCLPHKELQRKRKRERLNYTTPNGPSFCRIRNCPARLSPAHPSILIPIPLPSAAVLTFFLSVFFCSWRWTKPCPYLWLVPRCT